MRSSLGVFVAGFVLLISYAAAPQNAVVWSIVDCSQSPLVAPPGTTCRGTNAFTGSDGQGQFQSSSVRGDNPYRFIVLIESASNLSHVVFSESGADYLRKISPRAKDAVTISGPKNRNGADYFVFKSSGGEECTGFRKPGPSRSGGYKWAMGGVLCLPKGTPLDEARIFEFVDSAKLK